MSSRRKVLALATGEDLIAALKAARPNLLGVELETRPLRSAEALGGEADGLAALVLEVDAARPGAVETFQAVVRAVPDLGVVAAARGADAEQVRRLFRAGAADVVVDPFTAEALGAALGELLAAEGPGAGGGRVIAVLKAGGGAGATLTAVNLAVLMQRGGHAKTARPRSTALLDLDLQFGDAAAALDLQPRSTLLDVLRAKDRFDGRFLAGVMTAHDSGLKVLAAPPGLVPANALDAPLADAILAGARAAHEVTVVDLPGAWNDSLPTILRRADLAVLVARPTVSGALRARRVLDALREARVSTPLFFVLNGHAGALEAIDRSARIERSLDLKVEASLTFDAAAGRAADRGRPVVDAFPGARLSRELCAAARKLELRLEAAAAPSARADAKPVVQSLAGASA